MNLTDVKEVKINGKTVKKIKINNNIVYERIHLILSASNSFVYNTGTVLINLLCERLPNTRIDLYQVVGLTKTKLDTLTTDENGEASYTYTGTGAGEVEFVAEYDGKESNKVTVDDYVPAATDIGILSSSYSVGYGTSITLTATVKDQHNQAMNGQTVTFKEGDTSLGTGTTNSSGIATLTISTLNIGAHTIKAVCGTANSSNITINVNKLNTSLNIEVPALVYSDVFDVTGVLKDSNNTPISGATVKLVWNDGTSHNTTATTDSNGEVTFHRDAPTSIADYTFKLQYEGTTNYNASDSSLVSRTVGKETSVITVSSPVTNQSVLAGDSITISGVLLDNDGDPVTNKSVLVKKGGSTLTTLTTGNDGSFSGSVSSTGWSAGSTTLSFVFENDSYYTDASQNVNVVVITSVPASITLSCDKPIMMKDEIATITATVLDSNDDPCEGQTVSFEVVNGESLGSATTDSSGQCSVYYLGKGVGDLNIKAECMLLNQTYEVEDCYKANLSASHTFGTSDTQYVIWEMPSILAYEIEGYVKCNLNNRFNIGIMENSQINDNFVRLGAYTTVESLKKENGVLSGGGGGQSYIANSNLKIKFIYNNGNMKMYVDDTLLYDTQVTFYPKYLYLGSYSSSKTVSCSDIKIKPL